MKTTIIIKTLIKFGAIILAFLAPVASLLYFTGFVIFADTITGIWASHRKGEKITSQKLKGILPKILLYPLIIVVAHWSETLIPEIPFVKGATFLLIVLEGKSIEENVSEILGISLFKYIKILVTKGRKGLLEEIK